MRSIRIGATEMPSWCNGEHKTLRMFRWGFESSRGYKKYAHVGEWLSQRSAKPSNRWFESSHVLKIMNIVMESGAKR